MSDPDASLDSILSHELVGRAVQRQLPVFPSESMPIGQGISVVRSGRMVVKGLPMIHSGMNPQVVCLREPEHRIHPIAG